MTSYFAPNDYRAKSYDVFISYKREDDHAREVLVLALESAGYEVFWDAKLNNDDWKDELRERINRCKITICLWSKKAAASEYVKNEAAHAFGLKRLLSAPIEDKSVVPEYFKNTNIHPFDAWADQTKRRAQIQKILATLERLTGGPSGRPEQSTPTDDNNGCPADFGDIPGAPDKLIGRDAELDMLVHLEGAQRIRLAGRAAEGPGRARAGFGEAHAEGTRAASPRWAGAAAGRAERQQGPVQGQRPRRAGEAACGTESGACGSDYPAGSAGVAKLQAVRDPP
jgi:hypothetical protein